MTKNNHQSWCGRWIDDSEASTSVPESIRNPSMIWEYFAQRVPLIFLMAAYDKQNITKAASEIHMFAGWVSNRSCNWSRPITDPIKNMITPWLDMEELLPCSPFPEGKLDSCGSCTRESISTGLGELDKLCTCIGDSIPSGCLATWKHVSFTNIKFTCSMIFWIKSCSFLPIQNM